MRAAVAGVAVVAYIAAFMILVFALAWLGMQYLGKEPVGDSIPRMFPVLVVTSDEAEGTPTARAIYQKDLAQYLEEHPGHSFLVREGMEETLKEQVLSYGRYRMRDFDTESPMPWAAWFEVEPLADGRQRFEVHCTWDDDRENAGWYEANDQEFTPIAYQRYFGPGLVMAAGAVAFVLASVLYVVGAVVFVRTMRRREPRIAAQQEE